MATRPARLQHPKRTTINPKDSRYERGTTGEQVNFNSGICPPGGCSANDIRSRLGIASPTPIWNRIQFYKGEGFRLPFRHIMDGHRFIRSEVGSPSRNSSMFARRTGEYDLRYYARTLHQEGVHRRESDGSWAIVGRIGNSRDAIGFTRDEVATNRLIMYLRPDGSIRTIYPF